MHYKVRIRVEGIQSLNKKTLLKGSISKQISEKFKVIDNETLDENQIMEWGDEIFSATTFKTFNKKPKSLNEVIEIFPEIDAWMKEWHQSKTNLFSNSIMSSYFSLYPERLIKEKYNLPLDQSIFKKLLNLLDDKKISIASLIDNPTDLSHTLLAELVNRKYIFKEINFYKLNFSIFDSYRFQLLWEVFIHDINPKNIQNIINEMDNMMVDMRIKEIAFLISKLSSNEIRMLLEKLEEKKNKNKFISLKSMFKSLK